VQGGEGGRGLGWGPAYGEEKGAADGRAEGGRETLFFYPTTEERLLLQCVAVWCRVLQSVAVCCSVLQCVAVCCSVLQCVAEYCIVRTRSTNESRCLKRRTIQLNNEAPNGSPRICASTHCNTLQHTATHCNTLQHTATHCNTLQHFTMKLPMAHLGYV